MSSAMEAEQTVVENQLGLSYIEVHYLLSVVDSLSAMKSRSILGLDSLESPEKLSLIAASTLLARGLLVFTEDGQSIVPFGQAMYVSYVLLNATRWFTFQSTDGADKSDTGFIIESDLGRVIAQPRALDTWWFVLIDGDAPAEQMVADTAQSLVEQSDEMALFLQMQTVDGDHSFTIHKSGEVWSFAHGETGDPQPEQRLEGISREEVLSALRAFVLRSTQ